MAVDIGKLSRAQIRSVWSVEPDFTTWLESSPEMLGEALGVEISSLSREQSAGDFYVDLVGEDDCGNRLIVENQFGKSDHDHLGKVLTYLSAFDAKTAVWIVETPRPEHVKAIAWLNDSSSASFFLLKIEALTIDDSVPAPMLTLIVGPSEESKSIGMKKQDLAEGDSARRRFWSELIQRLKDKGISLHANRTPGTAYWISTGVGTTGLELNYVIRKSDAQVELYIDKYDSAEENGMLYNHFFNQRQEIESTFGDTIEWQNLLGKRAFRIAKRLEVGGLKDEERWEEIQEAMIDTMTRFHAALKPHIDAL